MPYFAIGLRVPASAFRVKLTEAGVVTFSPGVLILNHDSTMLSGNAKSNSAAPRLARIVSSSQKKAATHQRTVRPNLRNSSTSEQAKAHPAA
jgi:hypothetical protein